MKSRGKLGIDSGSIGRGSGVGGGPRSVRTGSPRSGATFTRKKGFSTLLSKKSSLLYRETQNNQNPYHIGGKENKKLLAKHGKMMNDAHTQGGAGTWDMYTHRMGGGGSTGVELQRCKVKS
jgi:hypothetical protein